MEAKPFLCLILLCGFAAVIASEVPHYIIRPSQSQSCPGDRYSSAVASVDNELTLSQFINNSSNYLINDTTLIFSPGNYSLESELFVENIHSFSMFVWSAPSSKAVFTCGHNARFEFRNINIVTVSGLEFVGCFENHVLSVGRFQLENSAFFGNGQAILNGTVLSIEESAANLDRVAFISAVEKNSATPQTLPEDCFGGTIEATNAVIGILLKSSNITITQSQFEGNKVGLGAVIYNQFHSDILISNTIFVNNTAAQFCSSNCCFSGGIVYASRQYRSRSAMKIYYSRFEGNVGVAIIIYGDNAYTSKVSIFHSEFVDNTIIGPDPQILMNGTFQSNSLITLVGVMTTVSLSEFINNRVRIALVYALHYTTAENNLTNNVFIDNIAAFEVFLSSGCRPGLSLSLGSSRCIQCSEHWCRDLIGIVVAAFIAGIALVIFMLVLNITIAVGTLNGIVFYANIVAANAETHFLPFIAPNFVTIFISWLNLDIGFDLCFSINIYHYHFLIKALLQLAFPAYVILLVIIVIVASECSSKFAKMIGKGNPVAVLTTMILLSYAKFFNVILTSFSLFYVKPGYGSRNVDVTRLPNVLNAVEKTNSTEFIGATYFALVVSILILLLCVIFAVLVFSWQWLLQYQDKAIFKWVRYQKLRLFLEPYHAPYAAKYRYWTGLLMVVRALIYLISLLNFSLDPRVDLMAVIFIVGGLILLKGVTAKRVYKNLSLDVMETAIYFNLVAFSALTWHNLDFGGNQFAVAYTSIMIIFILLLGVIVFHVLRYTRLYKLSFVEKAFKWTSFKLLEKKPKEHPPNDAPEELDGYQLERSAAGDRELPTITYSVVEINQPTHDQEENYTE